MTQQPDPFSELRGLMTAANVLAGYPEGDESDADLGRRFIAARASVQTLLDERDRLIGEAAEAKRMAHEAFCIGVSHQEARLSAEGEVEKLKSALRQIVDRSPVPRYLAVSPTPEQQRQARNSPLYEAGDACLYWINEGDFYLPATVNGIARQALSQEIG